MRNNTGGKKRGTPVAKAIVTVIPSMEGSRKEIESEFSKSITEAAKTSGEAGGRVLGEALSKGASAEVKEELPKSVEDSAPKVKQAVKSTLESAVNGTVSAPVKDGVKSALTNAMSDVNEATKGTVDKLFSGGIVASLKKSIPTGLTSGFEHAKSVVHNSVEKVLDVGKGVADSVKSKLPEGMVSAFSKAKSTITGVLDKVVGGGLKDSIKSKMPPAFTEALGNIKSTVKNTLGKIMSSGIAESLRTSMGNALTSGINSAKTAVKNGLHNLFHGGISDAVKTSLPSAFNNGLSTMKLALGNTLGNLFTNAIQSAASSIKDTFSSAFNDYADFQQLEGGVETLFKDSAGVVMENARNAFKAAGMSANDYMETVTSFSASLISSLGGDTAKAATLADKALVDMSDNANKMGTDISLIQNAYQGFAKQNYTMLDNLKLGYGGTQAEMARLINDTGVMGDTFEATAKNINEVGFDKIIEAIHIVQERMDITGTTSREAASTIQGSIGMMKASWQDFLGGLANPDADISQLSKNLVESFKTVLANAIPAIKQMIKGAGEGILDILDELGLKAASDFIRDFLKGMDNDAWLNAFGSIRDTLQIIGDGLGRLFGNLDGAALASFVSDIGAAVIVLSDTLGALWPVIEQYIGGVKNLFGNLFGNVDTWELFKGVVQGIADVMGTLFTVMSNTVLPAIGNVAQVIGGGLSEMLGNVNGFELLANVITLLGNAFASVLNVMAQLWPVIEPLINLVKDVGVTAFDAFFQAIASEEAQGALGELVELLGNITGSVSEFLTSILPDSEGMADVLKTIFDILGTIFGVINDNWPMIEQVFGVIADVVGTVFGDLWDILKEIGETIAVVADEVAKNLMPNFEGFAEVSFGDLIDAIKEIAGIVKDSIITALEWIQEHGDLIGAIIGGIINAAMIAFSVISGIIKGIVDVIKWISDRIKEIGGAIDTVGNTLFPGAADFIKNFNFSFAAEGGETRGPVIAGEAGPEFIWPKHGVEFDHYASGIAQHLAGSAAGGDTYILVDGAVVNSSDDMKRSFYDNMMELKRLGVMNSGSTH